MKTIEKTFWTLVTIGCLASCTDDWGHPIKGGGNHIIFDRTIADSALTGRSVSYVTGQDMQCLTTVGKDTIFLKHSETVNPVWLQQKTEGSRAVVDANAFTDFYVNAFSTANELEQLMNEQLVNVTQSGLSYSPLCQWPGSNPVTFIGWAARDAAGSVNVNIPTYQPAKNDDGTTIHKASFTFDVPQVTEGARAQPDIILSIKPDMKQSDNPVTMDFHHALAAVAFKVSTVPDGTVIKGITLQGIDGGGICTFTYDDSKGLVIDWVTNGQKGSWTQTSDWTEGEDAADALVTPETTFMMIPQVLDENAEALVHFKVGEAEYTSTASLNGIEWKPGRQYTYTITTHEYAKVNLISEEEDIEDAIKEEVDIQNIGLVNSYIRASINGYWQTVDGIILMSWDINDANVGYVEWGAGWSDFWGLNAVEDDGFYYHRKPVAPGHFTEIPLLQRYELTSNPPTVDSNLEFNVGIQIVRADEVESLWNVRLIDGEIQVK